MLRTLHGVSGSGAAIKAAWIYSIPLILNYMIGVFQWGKHEKCDKWKILSGIFASGSLYPVYCKFITKHCIMYNFLFNLIFLGAARLFIYRLRLHFYKSNENNQRDENEQNDEDKENIQTEYKNLKRIYDFEIGWMEPILEAIPTWTILLCLGTPYIEKFTKAGQEGTLYWITIRASGISATLGITKLLFNGVAGLRRNVGKLKWFAFQMYLALVCGSSLFYKAYSVNSLILENLWFYEYFNATNATVPGEITPWQQSWIKTLGLNIILLIGVIYSTISCMKCSSVNLFLNQAYLVLIPMFTFFTFKKANTHPCRGETDVRVRLSLRYTAMNCLIWTIDWIVDIIMKNADQLETYLFFPAMLSSLFTWIFIVKWKFGKIMVYNPEDPDVYSFYEDGHYHVVQQEQEEDEDQNIENHLGNYAEVAVDLPGVGGFVHDVAGAVGAI